VESLSSALHEISFNFSLFFFVRTLAVYM
jgi:hypothetical protein